MATVQGVKLKKGGTTVFPITHINAVKNENGKNLSEHLTGLLSGKANSSHNHAISDITNLQNTLNGKSDSDHTHSYAPIPTYVVQKGSDSVTLPPMSIGQITLVNVYGSGNGGLCVYLPSGGKYAVIENWGGSGTLYSGGSLILEDGGVNFSCIVLKVSN